MYYVTDGLYCLSNQVIWQGSPFIRKMQALPVDSDDFVALSTCSSNVALQETRRAASIHSVIFIWLLNRCSVTSFFFDYFLNAVLTEIACLI